MSNFMNKNTPQKPASPQPEKKEPQFEPVKPIREPMKQPPQRDPNRKPRKNT